MCIHEVVELVSRVCVQRLVLKLFFFVLSELIVDAGQDLLERLVLHLARVDDNFAHLVLTELLGPVKEATDGSALRRRNAVVEQVVASVPEGNETRIHHSRDAIFSARVKVLHVGRSLVLALRLTHMRLLDDLVELLLARLLLEHVV